MASRAVLALAVMLCCATAAVAITYECKADSDCKPSKPCEYGKCNYGKCQYKQRPDGYACDDGNPCTVNDTCSYGVCQPGKPKKCASQDKCKTATCNTYSGKCEESPKPDGSPCNDGNPCTVHDKCSYGVCQPGKPKKCASKDKCKTATCNTYSGKCEESPKPDGSPCNDGNPCTVHDKCSYGVCQPGAPKKCASKDQCKTATCNTYSGKCEESPKPDGSPCNDGNNCTENDKCSYGKCAGADKSCPTTKQCTKSYCNPLTGQCKTDYLADGTPCNDGKDNTYNDKCSYGVCKGTPKYG